MAASSTSAQGPGHKWSFFSAGGFDQVKLDRGSDLAALDQLDQKLWVALACPTRGLVFDSRTLELIDADKDGRIRAQELIAAVKWTCDLLKNPDELTKGSPSLPLSLINDATPEGARLLASARQILTNLKKLDAGVISIEDTTDTARIFSQTQYNGDGIVPPDAASDDASRVVINEIIACLGGEPDRSGKPGISQARMDDFFAQAQAFSDWWTQAETDPSILPLGDATGGAYAAVHAVKAKVDDYFARCRLAAFDARAQAALNRDEKDYQALSSKDLSITASEVSGFPLAAVEAGRPLGLESGINPAWADAIADLRSDAIKPFLGERTALTENDWATIQTKLAPYECWLAAKKGLPVEKLGLQRVREILGSNAKDTLTALIAKDKSVEVEFNAIATVDKLVRFHRDLHRLCQNFVNFKDFYGGGGAAIFQAGTLYLDQRSCQLCLPVEDAGKHASMAGMAGAYLAYCDCVRKGTGEKMQIVAAFTDGDSDNLMVGRNGIFYDRKGLDWDATITRIVENSISLRQAFWAPYKKLVRMIEEQIAKRAAAADADAQTRLSTTASTAVHLDKTKIEELKPKKIDVGTVAALGVALGSIGAAFGYFINTIAQVEDWQLPLIAILIVLAISGPSMLIAYMKLRKRNLGPILDANGWAVNARARINVPFGTSLTGVAKRPVGSTLDETDRFADKRSAWPKLAVTVFVIWWIFAFLNAQGCIYAWTHGAYGKNRDKNQSQQTTPPTPSKTNSVPTESR
jgi:hypothetical protein